MVAVDHEQRMRVHELGFSGLAPVVQLLRPLRTSQLLHLLVHQHRRGQLVVRNLAVTILQCLALSDVDHLRGESM